MNAMTVVLAIGGLLVGTNWAVGAEQEPVDFNRDVRPILSDNCFQCHGPDGGRRQAELRLDLEQGLFADRGGHAAVKPENVEASELYTRLTAEDEDLRMPPAGSGKALSRNQIELIRRWIEQGAKWKGHWAYVPPVRPRLPDFDGAKDLDPIDRFIVARLNEKGLQLSPEADRRTLIRRLYFDLLGLPPTPKQTADFLNDSRPDAYERLVESVLSQPQFGERMALYWLDVVRYADTNGYHGDNHRDVWMYRDYVINAFNDNMPFDRFTIEQLAGDLVPNATIEQRIASGYNRLLMTTREGGAQPKEYLAKYAADRTRNTSVAWLGATMGCCECHDHKYDPFTMKDFYRFAAFFADLQEVAVGEQPPYPVPSPEQQQRLNELDAQIAQLQKVLETSTPELEASQRRWEQAFAQQSTIWTAAVVSQAKSDSGSKLTIDESRTVVAEGKAPDKDRYTLTVVPAQRKVTAVRLDVLADAALPAKGPGRAGNGNFVLHELVVRTSDGRTADIAKVVATHSQGGWDAAGAADRDPKSGWAILPKTGADHYAVLLLAAPIVADNDSSLEIQLDQNHGGGHLIGRFRISTTDAESPLLLEPANTPAEIAAILQQPEPERTSEQKAKLQAHYRAIAPQLAPIREELAKVQQARNQLFNQVPTTLVSMTQPPREMRVLPRGNWLDDSGEIVEPGVPEFLPGLNTEQRATRLDLARWMTSDDNPLTARVFVNRLWKLTFGEGLATTLDDFGAQGTWPTHPALLDWLAVEFRESGWDVKHMLRSIVTSRTYRQSSAASTELLQLDPYNRWLARQGRFRLEAEMVRDNALAVSGLLNSQLGGPSVKPYQPAGYWDHLNFPKRTYQADAGGQVYRRGLYTYWCRTFLHPSLLAFDASTREECTVHRPRSNTPLQALVLLNDPTYVEAARALAERLLRAELSGPEERLNFAFQRCLQRDARAKEKEILVALQQKHETEFKQDEGKRKAFLQVGQLRSSPKLDEAELASWTAVTRVLLNLHETIHRQ